MLFLPSETNTERNAERHWMLLSDRAQIASVGDIIIDGWLQIEAGAGREMILYAYASID